MSETITFNRRDFTQFTIAQGEEGFAQSLPDEVEDPRLALLTDALKNMCDCASAFAGRESIPASEFMEKAGPVVANAAKVLGQVQE